MSQLKNAPRVLVHDFFWEKCTNTLHTSVSEQPKIAALSNGHTTARRRHQKRIAPRTCMDRGMTPTPARVRPRSRWGQGADELPFVGRSTEQRRTTSRRETYTAPVPCSRQAKLRHRSNLDLREENPRAHHPHQPHASLISFSNTIVLNHTLIDAYTMRF